MNHPQLLRPGLALCPTGRVMRRPWALLRGGAIAEFGDGPTPPLPADTAARDHPELVLLPGFINSHTHLRLTAMAGRLPPTRDFWQWIIDLVETTRGMTADEEQAAVADGLAVSLACGTTTLCDFTRPTAEIESPVRRLIAHELIAFRPSETAARMAAWAESGCAIAAPHAVYSTTPELIEMLADQVRRRDGLLTIHVSETEDENRHWQTGVSDGLCRYFAHFDVDRSDWRPPRCSPTQYLARLSALGDHALLVHGNCLSDNDIELIARADAAVCFCPATHQFFGHPPHPLPRLIGAGVRVCLGSDSLASSPSLSMWDQARIVARDFPSIGWAALLAMITSAGARALRLPPLHGTLQAGAPADLVLAWPQAPLEEVAADPRRLFEGDLEIEDVLIDGQSALSAPEAA